MQIALSGHPVTTGLPSIDYFLSTRDFEGADASHHYGDRLTEESLDGLER